jgi:hypothetical protein
LKPEDAKKNLEDLRDSLNEVLGNGVSEDKKEKSFEFRDSAKEDKASFFQKMLGKAREIPVVDTFSQLGVAGSVAISSAAVTQTDLAKDMTEVFIAEIANDVVEQRIEPPAFMDDFIDFYELNDWGEVVIAERFVEAQTYASEVSPQIVSKIQSGEIAVSKQASSSASDNSEPSSDSQEQESSKPQSQSGAEQTKEEGQEKESSKGNDDKAEKQSGEESKDTDKSEDQKSSDSEQNKNSEDVKQEDTEQKEEAVEEKEVKDHKGEPEVKETEEASSEPKIDESPRVETPFEDPIDEIKPHQSTAVSPVL